VRAKLEPFFDRDMAHNSSSTLFRPYAAKTGSFVFASSADYLSLSARNVFFAPQIYSRQLVSVCSKARERDAIWAG